jgi:D-amino-acid dehydrogenase
VIGVASAYFLHRAGWQVTLVDRGEIGRACSYGNACLIVPSHAHPLPGPGVVGQALRWMLRRDSPVFVKPRLDPGFVRWALLFRGSCRREVASLGAVALRRLGRASIELFDELVQTPGIAFYYQRRGLLHVYMTQRGFAASEHELEELGEAGFDARRLSRDDTLALEPAASPRIHGGLFISTDAHAHSFDYVRAVAAYLEGRGVRLVTQRAVSRIVTRRAAVHGVALGPPAHGRQADGPSEEVLPADVVVLAAGAWTAALAADLGIRIPLEPAKGYSCTIDAYPGSPALPLYVTERRIAITPLGSRVRFGGTLEFAGFDEGLNATRYRAVVDGARAALGDSLRMENEEAWYGFRPITPDGLPIIAPAPGIAGLILATGHAMLGLTLSPITGKLVAELASGEPPSLPLDPFRLQRF